MTAMNEMILIYVLIIYHLYFSGILDICFRHLDQKCNTELNILYIYKHIPGGEFLLRVCPHKNIDIFLDNWEYWIVLVFFPFDRIDS